MTTLEFKPKLFSTLKDYNRKQLTTDLLAGIIVGIVALPLAIAFGIASGVTPEKGIITAIVAGLIVSVFGGSKVQIGGPTGAFIIIIYGIIQQYGFEGLTIATLLAGVFLIMFGVLHLGTIIKYIPYPIVVGFTSGIALTIFTTQIKDLFGLTMASVPSDFIEKWVAYIGSFPTIDWWSAAVGIGSVAVIALWPKIARYNNVLKKLPGSLIAIIVMTIGVLLLKQYMGVTSVETIGDRFSISNQLPGAQVPELTWDVIKGLVAPAFTIAILGAIESLLSATVADGVIGDRHNSNTELIAQGFANLHRKWQNNTYKNTNWSKTIKFASFFQFMRSFSKERLHKNDVIGTKQRWNDKTCNPIYKMKFHHKYVVRNQATAKVHCKNYKLCKNLITLEFLFRKWISHTAAEYKRKNCS